jgi:hypothetical protein
MGYKVAYLVKTYNPSGQQYQTILYLVQIVGEWTWESKGAKHIKVLGIEDKR